ncbi:Rhodanese-like domain-containing protein [Corynascus novoguineensis]|uniref:Rhodanese-like domain-containing protein n=1 Tax=Corynascus novoguineensis TaxID=1126955 RepID=A0AAN7HM79_9PEZI|nr:Rhodanese-like domain-containing protein [Corynascus novoguineensis]
MASRRAAVRLFKVPVPSARPANPACIRVAAQSVSRQYHSRTQRQLIELVRQQSSPVLRRISFGPASARPYSTESEAKPSKIWDFEALQKLTSNPNHSVIIIDVREPHELKESGRIPGALNVPVGSAPDSFFVGEDEFEDRFGRPRPPRDAEVVFYCRAGVRSRAAAGLARDAGWTNVGEYPGSWLDWVAKGGKIER